MLTRGGRAVENELGSEHANHDLNEKAAEIASQEVANEDLEKSPIWIWWCQSHRSLTR